MAKETEKPEGKKNKPPSQATKFEAYARYSGIAFQAVAMILLGTFGGHALDKHFENRINWITAVAAIVSTALALYYLIKQLTR
ncbi:MAG: AtpZ/AtpI family protein [Flavobacteriales bacterium]|nr:AtpZ/AtpI family protein [Flavobacteriales bacterium]